MSFKGTAGPEFIRGDETFIHGEGWSYNEEWHGDELQVYALAKSLGAAGYQVNVNERPPIWVLSARRQARNATEFLEFYDRFTITKELIEKPLFSDDQVQSEISDTWIPNTGSTAQDYISLIQDALKECNTDALPDQSTYPQAWRVHAEMVKGQESFEDEYIVLNRERVVGIRYGQKLNLPERNISTIYTTDELKSVFSITDFTGITWPTDPATVPSNTKWGWRSRHRRIDWVEGQKVVISEDWAYAAWSTYLYTEYVAP